MKFIILIPTYNERGNIEVLLYKIAKIVKKYRKNIFDIYIIDDNSPDKTPELVRLFSKKVKIHNLTIHILNRNKKEGIGKAYLFGFNYVLDKSSFDYALQMDADLSHDPKHINQFIKAAESGCDLIVGSRYMKGGSLPKNWPLYRKYLSIFGNLFIRLLLGQAITDYTGGLNMYSIDILKKLDFSTLDASGYGFLIGLKYRSLQKAKKYKQVPIQFHDRFWGESKMPLNTLHKNFMYVIQLKLND